MKGGILQTRAVNECRKKSSVVSYLALRNYLYNKGRQADEILRPACIRSVMERTSQPYYHSLIYKGFENGVISYRAILSPPATEIMAEAALLDECSRHPDHLSNLPCTYSNRLAQENNGQGIFRPYDRGGGERIAAIAEACRQFPDGVVRLVDIRQFFPSLDRELVSRTWKDAAGKSGIPPLYRELGDKIIDDYRMAMSTAATGIPAGPIFCAYLADLVLRRVDSEFLDGEVRYIRWVDDIMLIGSAASVAKSMNFLKSVLRDLGLRIHEDTVKNVESSTSEWLARNDVFQRRSHTLNLKMFLHNVNQYLLFRPGKAEALYDAFQAEGFRIPRRTYKKEPGDITVIEHMKARAKNRNVSRKTLLQQARFLRELNKDFFREYIEKFLPAPNKYLSPDPWGVALFNLRYQARIALFFADDEELSRLAPIISAWPDLQIYAATMTAIASGQVDEMLAFGQTAVLAGAMALKASGKQVFSARSRFSDVERQSLGLLTAAGLCVKGCLPTNDIDTRFFCPGSNAATGNIPDHFIREFAQHQEGRDQPHHSYFLETAFNRYEAFDMPSVK